MSAILILGAANWADGPSPALKRRCLHAAEVWKARPVSWVIACGGVGDHPPAEATVMRDVLEDAGVAPEKIFQECHSTSTLENIQMALPIIRLLGVTDITIVTDAYHTKRALMVAHHFGLSAVASSPENGAEGLTKRAKQQARESAARLLYRATLSRTPKNG